MKLSKEDIENKSIIKLKFIHQDQQKLIFAGMLL
jgi:hypothetical protein